jgi:hypothetical protein
VRRDPGPIPTAVDTPCRPAGGTPTHDVARRRRQESAVATTLRAIGALGRTRPIPGHNPERVQADVRLRFVEGLGTSADLCPAAAPATAPHQRRSRPAGAGYLRELALDRRQAASEPVLDTLGLTDAADRRTRGYAGGRRRRLDLGGSLVGPAARAHPRQADHRPRPAHPHRSAWEEVWELVESFSGREPPCSQPRGTSRGSTGSPIRIVVVDRGRVIAGGTADALKARCGTDVIDVRPRGREQAELARPAVASSAPPGTGTPTVVRRLMYRSSRRSAVMSAGPRPRGGGGGMANGVDATGRP